MPSPDVIRLAIAAQIDRAGFESMVCAILAQDDLPHLQRLAGIARTGVDAVEEAFFEDDALTKTVVQVTSETAHDSRFQRTIHRLTNAGVICSQLVMVCRHPVAGSTRRAIAKRASALNISVDVRDAEYLIHHLGNPRNGIYACHFGDARRQVDVMLDRDDPLNVIPSRELRAMLAAIGAYVLLPHSRLARRTLFQRTVLASLAAAGGPVSLDDLLVNLHRLLPEEELDSGRLRAAVDALAAESQCDITADRVAVSSEGAAALAAALAGAHAAFDRLLDHVLTRAGGGKLDPATRQSLARNTQRAIAFLFRLQGPGGLCASTEHLVSDAPTTLLGCISESVKPDLARRALISLLEFVREPANQSELAVLMHTYAALFIRDLDPVGRRWQQTALERSYVALDTDVVLRLLVEELPESLALLAALRSLTECGVKLVIPEWVMLEAAEYVERAPRTYRRFAGVLGTASSDYVDGEVWHPVVRGFHYASISSPTTWEHYYEKYRDDRLPRENIEHVLSRRIAFSVSDFVDVPADCDADMEEIAATAVAATARALSKTASHDEENIAKRVRASVRTAMAMATTERRTRWTTATGYVASNDAAFGFFESHRAWRGRPRVHLSTGMLSAVANFVAGSVIDGEAFVRLLFDPVTAAAASEMKPLVQQLSAAGVKLSGLPLGRLEWDLREDVEAVVLAGDLSADGEEAKVLRLIQVAKLAAARGYPLRPEMSRAVEILQDLRRELATVGQGQKGHRSIRRALARFGLSTDDLLAIGADIEEPSVDTQNRPPVDT